jgi:hypothetical protein
MEAKEMRIFANGWETVLHRFFSKVKKTHSCWEWKSSINNKGYGQFHLDGKTVLASRLSWKIHYGEFPEGFFVLHKCDNPRCVRPDHLFLGNALENTLDAISKNRLKNPPLHLGEFQHLSKLSEEKVRKIRSSKKTISSLASEFGVSFQTVWKVSKRLTWRHVI